MNSRQETGLSGTEDAPSLPCENWEHIDCDATMDLKNQLLAWMLGCAAVLMVLACALTLRTLRDGVDEEMRGAEALTDLLVAAEAASRVGDEAHLAALEAQLAAGRYRHLVASWSDSPGTPPSRPAAKGLLHRGLDAWLPEAPSELAAHRIRIGERELVLRPAPDNERDEVLGDAAALLATVLAVLVVMVVCMRALVQRALAPVRHLQAGLARLEQGAVRADFPALRLNEYALIATGIDAMSHALGQAQAAQQRLTQQLIDVQEQERREISQELHDELGQHLTALSATVALLRRHGARLPPEQLEACATELHTGVRQISTSLRSVLNHLLPRRIATDGLRRELVALVDSWRDRVARLQIDASIPPLLPALSAEAGLALYRCLQEALTNVVRHSGASAVRVELVVRGDMLHLRVADNGHASRPDAVESETQQDATFAAGITPGRGLRGLRERLDRVGGRLSLRSDDAAGLRFEVQLPCVNP